MEEVLAGDEGSLAYVLDEAWDDVHGGVLPLEDVRAARREEVQYMELALPNDHFGFEEIQSFEPLKDGQNIHASPARENIHRIQTLVRAPHLRNI